MKEKVYIEEAGCCKRKLDIKAIRSYLESNGYKLVARPQDADRILVMTCAFKKLEEDESVQRVRHFRKYGSKVTVYGCLPDIARERYKEFADIPKVAPREIEKIEQLFPGNTKCYAAVADSNLIDQRSENVFDSIARVVQTQPTIDREFWRRTMDSARNRISDILSPPMTTYYLFICRGCLGQCSYCAIRKAIGTVRSKSVVDVVAEFRRGIKDSYCDFTILGDDPGCYGIDLGSSLPELLQALFAVGSEAELSESRAGSARVDIAFHLYDIHPKFLILYADKFLEMDHFSLVRSILCPIQSGSSRVLGLMQREHTAEQLEEAVKKLQAQQPQIVFNTQIIIGFPSETEHDFQETLDFVVRSGFKSVVIFPYDDKDGAASSLFPEKIPAKMIQKRMRKAFRSFKKAGVTTHYKQFY
jgi:MiaB/RimO family radical SAM methylthiotransferase